MHLQPQSFSSSTKPISLLDLSPDILRACAYWLRPRDRLNFATTCKYLYHHLWASDAIPDLTDRFPIEHRLQFPLQVSLDIPSSSTSSNHPPPPQFPPLYLPHFHTPPLSPLSLRPPPMILRMVPNRSLQQHVNIAVSSTGSLVAVLPYDNYLRILNPSQHSLLSLTKLAPVFHSDVWEVIRGRRRAHTRPNYAVYADEAALDLETTLEFTSDDSNLLIASPITVSLYKIIDSGRHISQLLSITLDTALEQICIKTNTTHYLHQSVAGTAAISPDGNHLAWVIFAGRPVNVYITFWKLHHTSITCTGITSLTTLVPRGWSTLSWARVLWTPAGSHCMAIVKTPHNMLGIRRVNNDNSNEDDNNNNREHSPILAVQRVRLCQFKMAVWDMNVVSNKNEDLIEPLRVQTEWLPLECNIYANSMAKALASLLHGLRVDLDRHAYGVEQVQMSKKTQLRMTGISMNSLHSCPAEATYKAMSFTQGSTRPWLVTKQPLYSIHLAMDGKRILVATSPHENKLFTLVKDGTHSDAEFVQAEDDGCAVKKGLGVNRRRHAFSLMPWRRGFATVTAFSGSGKWLAGVSLLDNDQCCVCLRNVTMTEYFE